MSKKLGKFVPLIFFILLFLFFISKKLPSNNQLQPHIFRDESEIIDVYGDMVIKDSIFLGLYSHGNNTVTVENSIIWRVVPFDNSKIILKDTRVLYVNDRWPQLEEILDSILDKRASHEKKILAIYNWTKTKIVHKEAPTYSESLDESNIQNFNVTKILEYMDGDCGAHTAVTIALAHVAGYPGRPISGESHMVAEIWYNGKWHVIDTDPGTGAELFYDKSGTILNAFELYKNPSLYDKNYFHTWSDEMKRYYAVGVGSYFIDGAQHFERLDKSNEERIKEIFYDTGWKNLEPNFIGELVVTRDTTSLSPKLSE